MILIFAIRQISFISVEIFLAIFSETTKNCLCKGSQHFYQNPYPIMIHHIQTVKLQANLLLFPSIVTFLLIDFLLFSSSFSP